MRKELEKKLKPGYLVNRQMLYSLGLSRPDVDYYLRSEYLVSVARGFYMRNNQYPLDWREVVASLYELGFVVHVGGATVISESGLDHFVSLKNERQEVSLFSFQNLPTWLNSLDDEITRKKFKFTLNKQSWLSNLPKSAYKVQRFGPWDRSIKYATLELALLEQLVEVKNEQDIVTLDRQMEGMASLSPNRLNQLLPVCTNVKAKRLFGWLADRHAHNWAKHINWDKIDCGSGKRSVVPGGRYNSKWKITMPQDMENQSVHGR